MKKSILCFYLSAFSTLLLLMFLEDKRYVLSVGGLGGLFSRIFDFQLHYVLVLHNMESFFCFMQEKSNLINCWNFIDRIWKRKLACLFLSYDFLSIHFCELKHTLHIHTHLDEAVVFALLKKL